MSRRGPRIPLPERDHLLFEAGIKLGAVYHQFVGIPVTLRSASGVERAMEAMLMAMPFATRARVRIDRAGLRRRRNRFGYAELRGDLLDIRVGVRVGGWEAAAVLRTVEGYPLMAVERLRRVRGG
ncbi:MAG: hypothetical protein HY558_01680 [Euryarchaeota archaeon]|nr:hypothetical protein [Euryarchaeota archaeon]